MNNAEVDNETMKKKPRKNKKEIKEELEESIINGEKHENKEFEEKARMVEKSDDVAEVFARFIREEIFQKFKERKMCEDNNRI